MNELTVETILLDLILTVIIYGFFPFVFSRFEDMRTKKKYKWFCWVTNFLVFFGLHELSNTTTFMNTAPYVLWTSIFIAIFKSRVERREQAHTEMDEPAPVKQAPPPTGMDKVRQLSVEGRLGQLSDSELENLFSEALHTQQKPQQPPRPGLKYTAPSKPKRTSSAYGTIGGILGALVVVGAITYGVNSSAPAPTPTPKPTVKAIPAQVMPANGAVFKSPTYEKLCPFSVSVRGDEGYYVRLKYMWKPESYNSRHLEGKPAVIIDDLEFFVRPGQTVEMDVPVGVYKLYYATGEDWYGRAKLFGEETAFFTSSDLLEFYTDYTTFYGHTLELWEQVNGNFSTTEINESAFFD